MKQNLILDCIVFFVLGFAFLLAVFYTGEKLPMDDRWFVVSWGLMSLLALIGFLSLFKKRNVEDNKEIKG